MKSHPKTSSGCRRFLCNSITKDLPPFFKSEHHLHILKTILWRILDDFNSIIQSSETSKSCFQFIDSLAFLFFFFLKKKSQCFTYNKELILHCPSRERNWGTEPRGIRSAWWPGSAPGTKCRQPGCKLLQLADGSRLRQALHVLFSAFAFIIQSQQRARHWKV